MLQTIFGIPEDNIINKKTPEQKKIFYILLCFTGSCILTNVYLFSSLHLLMSAAVALVNTLAAFLRTLNSPKEITKQIMVKE